MAVGSIAIPPSESSAISSPCIPTATIIKARDTENNNNNNNNDDDDTKSITSTSSINTNSTTTNNNASLNPIDEPDGPSKDRVPIEGQQQQQQRRPLPSGRELSKVLCRIVDTDVYGDSDREIALGNLGHWASLQDPSFGSRFADVGGIQQVLFFIEDNPEDCHTIAPALLLLETLLRKPLHGNDDDDDEEMRTMRTKIGNRIVDAGGLDLMRRIFRRHALHDSGTATRDGESTRDEKGNTESPSSPNSSSSSSSIVDVVSRSPCFFFECGYDSGSEQHGNHQQQQQQLEEESELRRTDTARHSLEVLALLIPCVGVADKATPSEILETLCETLLVLLTEEQQFQTNNTKRTKESRQAALVAALMKCLVKAMDIGACEPKDNSNSNSNNKDNEGLARKLVSVANRSMRTFPSHQGINRDGCLLLRSVSSKHLITKSERKTLGIVASLGSVVASEDFDRDLKELADGILEEQFR